MSSHRNVMREVLAEFRDAGNPPASTLLLVSGFFRPDVLFEVEAVALADA